MRAESFEDAAGAALEAGLDIGLAAVAASPFAKRARLLRAMVHHRPDDGYRGLVVVEVAPDGKRAPPRVGDGTHLPSATAWSWVRTHGAAAAIDVVLGTVTSASGAIVQEARASDPFDATASVGRLRDREATHVFVVPIRGPLHRMEGMLVLEASCQAAVGTPFVWDACANDLALIAGLCAQYFARLPGAPKKALPPDELLPVIGPSMSNVVQMLRVFAEQDETILLRGPTGAGKSRLARWCHERSPAKGGPFEALDLTSMPENLQLAELFGWKRGAFTDAVKDTRGALARAEKGTLFIDEIDKLSLGSQAGLLRLLEEKKYRPLGDGDAERSASVRFLIGTNADLEKLVEEGKFRLDLYYRVNVLPVRIPPLRERADEIADWARFMLRRRHGGEAAIHPDAEEVLTSCAWPGNLRQLDNII
jgi:hypothetical protein